MTPVLPVLPVLPAAPVPSTSHEPPARAPSRAPLATRPTRPTRPTRSMLGGLAKRATLAMLAMLPTLALACSSGAAPAPTAASASASAPSSDVAARAHTQAPAPAHAQAELDQLDPRAPVPLLPMMANHQKRNMRDHLVAVQEIVAALATDDLAAVERAAARIGFSEQMGQTCTHMGAGAPGFTEQALAFHRTADRIGAAARDGDRARTLRELGATLATCTGCHAAWKQQVVDEPTWTRLTASEPPTGHPGHGAH